MQAYARKDTRNTRSSHLVKKFSLLLETMDGPRKVTSNATCRVFHHRGTNNVRQAVFDRIETLSNLIADSKLVVMRMPKSETISGAAKNHMSFTLFTTAKLNSNELTPCHLFENEKSPCPKSTNHFITESSEIKNETVFSQINGENFEVFRLDYGVPSNFGGLEIPSEFKDLYIEMYNETSFVGSLTPARGTGKETFECFITNEMIDDQAIISSVPSLNIVLAKSNPFTEDNVKAEWKPDFSSSRRRHSTDNETTVALDFNKHKLLSSVILGWRRQLDMGRSVKANQSPYLNSVELQIPSSPTAELATSSQEKFKLISSFQELALAEKREEVYLTYAYLSQKSIGFLARKMFIKDRYNESSFRMPKEEGFSETDIKSNLEFDYGDFKTLHFSDHERALIPTAPVEHLSYLHPCASSTSNTTSCTAATNCYSASKNTKICEGCFKYYTLAARVCFVILDGNLIKSKQRKPCNAGSACTDVAVAHLSYFSH